MNEECIDITCKGLTPEKLVSSRFWEMRKLIVDFGMWLNNADRMASRGDMVMITSHAPDVSGPWIVMGIDDRGHYVLTDAAGRSVNIASWNFPLLVDVLVRMSECDG